MCVCVSVRVWVCICKWVCTRARARSYEYDCLFFPPTPFLSFFNKISALEDQWIIIPVCVRFWIPSFSKDHFLLNSSRKSLSKSCQHDSTVIVVAISRLTLMCCSILWLCYELLLLLLYKVYGPNLQQLTKFYFLLNSVKQIQLPIWERSF